MSVRYAKIASDNDLKTSHRQLWKYPFFRDSGLPWTLFSLSLFINIFVIYRLSRTRSEFPLRELNGLVPEFPTKEVIFWPHEEFVSDHQSNRSIAEVGERWLSLLPRGNGFIAIEESKLYNLPEPIEIGRKQVFTPAVFHQLHCLYMIMHHYEGLLSNKADPHYTLDGDDLWHVDHCFDYLRQSIQCCSDTALEGQGEMKAPGTDGSGGVHICKDYELIRIWAEEGRITDLTHN